MKKVAIVGLGWLGMPLAMSLSARGWQVTGSKTTQDGVEAARMSGIDSYLLRMEPELVCDSDDLDALMDADALVITLPARRSGPGDEFYLQAVQELVDSALAHRIPRIIFTSSTSVYGDAQGTVKETTPRNPVTNSGRVLEELEDWLHNLPGTSVDILRLAGLVGPGRHPGRFFAGKTAPDGEHGVNLVHFGRMLLALSLCCYRHLKADTSIIYVRQLTLRVMFSIRRWPVYWGWNLRSSEIVWTAAKVRLLMAVGFVMNWGLNTSIPIRW